MLGHLATGEMHTYHWLVGWTTICKFVLVVCLAILAEFQKEYLTCPTDPEDWGKFRGEVQNKLECLPCSWSAKWETHLHEEAQIWKCFTIISTFSLVLLALVDTDYRLFLVGVVCCESSSDNQIFNHRKFRMIREGRIANYKGRKNSKLQYLQGHSSVSNSSGECIWNPS